MKTALAKIDEIEKKWFVIDAEGKILGRLATTIADILRGKHKPIFHPSYDAGDFVVVVNADKIVVTGKKTDQKFYTSYSGYPGGMRITHYKDMMKKDPAYIIEHAVKGMLTKNSLGRAQISKLKVYAGAEHPHAAQQPTALAL